jgi:3-hydroxyacyl-CoA dehydrogenase / enoyl-CoA hydratase / 3-hydroxybutyryl-CoA epimerase
METKYIEFKTENDIFYVGFGKNTKKSMTVLDESTLKELNEIMTNVNDNQSGKKGLIIHSLANNCFLAGADISLIDSLTEENEAAAGAEMGQKLYNIIEDLSIPTIACVHGPCLGGGLELAMSCDHIICSDDSKTSLGLPEVKLGILPGFGGTFRLPQRIGLPASLDLILAGKMLNAKKAKKLGLVSEVYPKENLLYQSEKHLLKKAPKKKTFKESLEGFATDSVFGRKIIFQKAREAVLKQTKGFYQAPLRILELMEDGAGKNRNSYLAMEAQAFGELCVGEQSQNLRHLFFMMENSKKLDLEVDETKMRKLNRGAALGAGTMGGGIAWLMAQNNMAPIMKDLNYDALELGFKQSSKNFQGALKRRKISVEKFNKLQRSIRGQTDFSGFNKVDLVIEAIVENMELKKSVFSDLEKHVSQGCLITSNTSSLSVEEMATALEKPERFGGLHFFNPVHKMPLVEIIKHSKMSDETVAALHRWVVKTKKTPVIVKDGPGFLVNRILMPYLNEAGYLLEEGVSIKDLDKACLDFGMPMGPCRLLDEIGIDVGEKVAKILHEGLGDRAESNGQSGQMVEKNFLGKKSGVGFYVYDENGKSQGINEEMNSLLSQDKKMDKTEIQMRVILPMINEAAYILEEGIVDTASDVDLGLIFGIGFPPFRGGLLRYADSEGLDRIYKALEGFKESVSANRYTPAPFLENLVKEKKRFYHLG